MVFGALATGPVMGQQPPTCDGGVTALVLSGGGAKGLAHVPVLQVLDRLGARPDLVVGTSMGALVGALYAGGYSGREIDSIARATPPTRIFGTGAPVVPRPWRPQVPLLIWEQGARGFALQSPALREADANTALAALMLRGNLQARGSFDSLPIPFRAVATDFATRDPVVLGTGDLAQAIRASIAVPLVFPPERVNGRLLTDGGLSANVPVAVARGLGATRVIVSDVSGRLLDPDDLRGPVAITEQLAAFLFQQAPDSLGPEDVHVRIGVQNFRALDTRPSVLDSIRAHGHRAADSVLPRARCLPRAGLAGRPLPSWVRAFSVRDGTPADERVLSGLLGLASGAELDLARLRAHLDKLADLDGFRAVWLHPTGSGDSVDVGAVVVPGPRRLAGGTFAYDHDLGGRLGAAWLDRRFLGSPLEASAVGGFGRVRTDLTLGLRRYFGSGRVRFSPAVEAYLAEETIPLYTADGTETGRPTTREAGLLAGVELDLAREWTVQVGVEGRLWRDVDTTGERRTGDSGRSGGVVVRATHHPGALLFVAEAIWTGTFRRLSGELAVEARSGKLTLTPRVRVGWGEALPMQAQFALGGEEGFPGLAVLERRGDREVLASVQGSLPLRGPFTARLLLAAGRSPQGGRLLAEPGWIGGARAGIGVDTPLGPVRFEYGVATTGRDNVFVRIGRWF